MAKVASMTDRSRRITPFVTTGIALATAGIVVAVPAIAPPLTPRDVQVVADVQTTLSAAQSDLVNSAALSAANPAVLLQGLQLAANVLAGSAGEGAVSVQAIANQLGAASPVATVAQLLPPGDPAVQQTNPVADFIGAVVAGFADGGITGAVLAGLRFVSDAVFGEDSFISAVIQGFDDGGFTGAIVAAIQFFFPPPGDELETTAAQEEATTPIAAVAQLVPPGDPTVLQTDPVADFIGTVVAGFADGGITGAVLAGLRFVSDAVFGEDSFPSAVIQGFDDGGFTGAVVAAIQFFFPPPGDEMETTAAEPEATTLIASVPGLLSQNAETNAETRIVDLFTPSQADELTADEVTNEEVTNEEVTNEEVTTEEVTTEEATTEEVTTEEVTTEEATTEEATTEEATTEEADHRGGDHRGGDHRGGHHRGGHHRGGHHRGGHHRGGHHRGGDHRGGDHRGGDHRSRRRNRPRQEQPSVQARFRPAARQ